MRQYPIVGERIVRSAPSLAPVAPLVRSSQERWDGSGYPDGLRTTEAPIGARIIAACDAYHAMRSAQPVPAALDPGGGDRRAAPVRRHAVRSRRRPRAL